MAMKPILIASKERGSFNETVGTNTGVLRMVDCSNPPGLVDHTHAHAYTRTVSGAIEINRNSFCFWNTDLMANITGGTTKLEGLGPDLQGWHLTGGAFLAGECLALSSTCATRLLQRLVISSYLWFTYIVELSLAIFNFSAVDLSFFTAKHLAFDHCRRSSDRVRMAMTWPSRQFDAMHKHFIATFERTWAQAENLRKIACLKGKEKHIPTIAKQACKANSIQITLNII